MSQQQQRLSVFPTRMTLTLVKQKEKAALKGHTLLKRKSDALTARFRSILAKIHAAKTLLLDRMRTATFSMAELHFAVGCDPSFAIREAPVQAGFQVQARLDNVSGVALPVLEGVVDEHVVKGQFELTALARGGQAVAKAREAHTQALHSLLQLASLQASFLLLDDVIRTTNRRVNALEYIVVPRLERTVQYIAGELEELDREEFYRLKKIQAKKRSVLSGSANAPALVDAHQSVAYEDEENKVQSIF